MTTRTILTRKTALAALPAAILALGVAACGGDDGEAAADPAVTVVASTTHVADLARNVGGDRAEVVGLVPANADPHDHEPRPSDAQAVAESDLVLQAGGDIDLWVEGLVGSSGTDAPVVELIDSVETIEGGHGHDEDGGDEHANVGDEHADEGEDGEHGDEDEHADEDDEHADEDENGERGDEDEEADEGDEHADDEIDPHWWQDPANAVLAVEEIRDRLTAIDPDGGEEYAENADRYSAELEQLDTAIAECLDSIPPRDRKLVTSHDALGYFAERYRIDVVGAAIPALSTQAQPSAGETAELVELIRDEEVKAVFGEAGVSDRLQRTLSNETQAELGGVLWADALGPEGSGAETYVEATAANARTMAIGFSGGEETCPGLPGQAP